jgi:membrane-bound lytic murein transglycosylase F
VLAGCHSRERLPFVARPAMTIDLADITKSGVLRAIVDNNSVSYFIYRGRPMGFEYELLQRLAKHLGVELKLTLLSGVNEAIDLLNKGEADVIAFPLTITSERQRYVSFTQRLFTTQQVLVQRKPDNWRTSPHEAEKKLIRHPVDLIGKEIFVMKNSAFAQRLRHLALEVGGEIVVCEDSAAAETESLIRKVARGEIDYTVTDQTFALVNAAYYPDLDVAMPISLPQQIGWAVRQNSPELLNAMNDWLASEKKSGMVKIIYDKYFNSPRTSALRRGSDYSSLQGDKLSPYDELLKAGAAQLGWDWLLLASVMYQESRFNAKAESWAGAQGLMQLMPETGEEFGAEDLFNPAQNIQAAVRYFKHLDQLWTKTISDPQERVKFILASYNVGLSHVIDARNLARQYGKNPTLWNDHVEYYLLQKSKPEFYRNPVAAAGYCHCEGPVNYVKEVLARYEEYKMHVQ